jgi:ribosomal protein RSM22 (predicted rRNA methylase)
LVIVEPGTPDGFSRIRAARAELVAQGARVVAPCPHDADCPLAQDNWCHFSVRVARSRRQRQLKGGEAPYEDEKYSYVIVAATPPEVRHARILRHPKISPGRIELTLCGARGLAERTVVRSDGGAFRLARKIRWGDTWDCD